MSEDWFALLSIVYLSFLLVILSILYKEYKRTGFNFNILFTLFYLLTFFFGFPLTGILIFRYGVKTVDIEFLFYSLLLSITFYLIYFISYRYGLNKPRLNTGSSPLLRVTRVEVQLTYLFLIIISVGSVIIFFQMNGLLLFQLTAYNQIFSQKVSGIVFKRFFYFFIPAMLLFFFVKPSKKRWLIFLLTTLAFGILTYILVGGTRANVMMAVLLFLLIGLLYGYIPFWMLLCVGSIVIVSMFGLALLRYNLSVGGEEAFYTFLYLTRDTFSPWENLALILSHYEQIEYQGLAPIVRDFYVYIPVWVWPEHPRLVLNSANYFTWIILDYHAGLAISPTLLGSLVIMGGVPLTVIGAIFIGLMIKWFDRVYESAKVYASSERYKSAILYTFCFSNVFNFSVLVREGLDAFISRLVFFSLIFIFCILLAKIIYEIFVIARVVRNRCST